jgi:hypothetical protein
MDKSEEKTPSTIPAKAGDPADAAAPTGAAAAGEPAAGPTIELASIDSPALAPTMTDMTAPGPDGPKIERPVHRPAAAEKFERIEPQSPHDAAGSREIIIPLAAPTSGGTSRWFGKFTLLAASVVLAAAFGAMAGTFGAAGVARLADEPAAPPEPPALQSTLTQLKSEVAALKASVEASSRTAGTQYSKLIERLDRVERAQSSAPKTDVSKTDASKTEAALPKETTGSVMPPGVTPLPPAAVPDATVPGWSVRDVYRGVAMLQSRAGGMVEVEPGDVLPGLGRIETIRRQDGRWVVMTSRGMITSLR